MKVVLICVVAVAAIGLIFGVYAALAVLLQYVYGWFASSHGWQPMPFWVAFGVVFLVGTFMGMARSSGSKS